MLFLKFFYWYFYSSIIYYKQKTLIFTRIELKNQLYSCILYFFNGLLNKRLIMLSNRNKGGIIITTSQKLKEEIEQMRIKLKLAIKETSLQSKRVNQISQELDRKILEYMIDKSKK
ncbi:hypothetical protein JCM15060_00150 [Halanaerobaculum tunisiense]